MKKLGIDVDEAAIIGLLRKNYDDRLRSVAEQYGLDATQGKADGSVVSPGLKLKRRSDGVLMTVERIGPTQVLLRSPEGELYKVTTAVLDDEYTLD